MFVKVPPQISSTILLAKNARQGEGGLGGLGSTSARCQAAEKMARSRNGTRVPSVRRSQLARVPLCDEAAEAVQSSIALTKRFSRER